MKRKLLLMNAALLLLLILIGSAVRDQWRAYRREHDVTKINVAVPAEPSTVLAPDAGSAPPLQAGDYNPIFEHSLFSPSRAEFEPPEPVAEVPAIPPLPGMPTLNGVTLIGERKIAFIQEPRAGAQPQNRTVQVGDTLMNFGKITEIRPDSLVFTWGGMTHVVEMLNSDTPKVRGPAAARLQTTVIIVGRAKAAASAIPSTAGAPVVGAPGAGPTIQIGTVGAATGAPAPGQGSVPAGGAARGSAVRVGNEDNRAPGASPAGVQRQNQQQNQGFIDTPFGRIARPSRQQ